MIKPTRISMVMMLLGLSCVMCAQIEWGSNTDLVNEFNPIQGRENYKLMVAIVGDKIKLVCEVAFASKPVKTIVWEIDGKHQNRERTQKEEEDMSSGKVFINDTFEIEINENEDDKRVSCVYDEESVEAILHVFKLEIVGDKIKLVCEVAFASKPVKTIVWEIDGKHQNRERTQKEEEDMSSGKVFINDTFEIEINENEDDKRVSCVYDEESVEAILHVFKLEIKKDKEVCDTCAGNVELLFRESLRSKTGENNVDERIKSKIQNIIKLTPNDKNSNSAYSVTIPIATAMNYPEVSKMTQDLKLCCPRPPEKQQQEIPWMYIIGIGGVGVLVVVVVVLVMKFKKKKPQSNTPHDRLEESQI